MKTLTKLNFLFLVLSFASCNIKAQKQTVVTQQNAVTLNAEEVQQIRTALNCYLSYDKAQATKAKEASAAIASKLNPSDPKAGENAKTSYDKNLNDVEQVANQGLKLLNINRYKDLMMLLDENINNFHAHPANTIGVEKKLHFAMCLLYTKYYSKDEVLKKLLALDEFTQYHYQALEGMSGEMDPDYPPFDYELANLYNLAGDYKKAIITLQEVLPLLEKTEGKKGEDYILVLKKLVENCERAGNTLMTEQYKRELGE